MNQFQVSLDNAVQTLSRGEAVIFPTDTVYGVGVSVAAAQSPALLYELKERDEGKPIAWLVSSAEALDIYGENVPDYAYDLAKKHWPGALTLVVRASAEVPQEFQSQAGTIGLRMPANETALALIVAAGVPLATTSANIAGEPAPYSAQEINPIFAQRVGNIIIDTTEKSGVASTIVDCTGVNPRVLRQGSVILGA